MHAPKVILASNSLRHRFFHDLGIPFLAESADIDESTSPHESPTEVVARLANAKTLTVAGRYTSEAVKTNSQPPVDILVIGADTVVAIDENVLGKPANAGEARTMLTRLRAPPPPGPHSYRHCPRCQRCTEAPAQPRKHDDRHDACLHRRRGRCLHRNRRSHGQGRRLRHSASQVPPRPRPLRLPRRCNGPPGR